MVTVNDDTSEIDSHKHVVQLCVDIILGAMAFRMNSLHLVIPQEAIAPGRKTLAKERLFNHILDLICSMDEVEVFEIDKSTLPDTAKERWRMPYRHWRFVPAEFRKSGI